MSSRLVSEPQAHYKLVDDVFVLHRTDGPAIPGRAGRHGRREWWVNGTWLGNGENARILDELYDAGDIATIEQALTLWTWAGPSLAELVDAVRACHL